MLLGNSNTRIEEEMLLTNPQNVGYIKARYMISDITESETYNTFFREKVNIRSVSDKYKNINMDQLDRNMLSFKILNSYAWKHILNDNNAITLFPELNIYFDIIANIYKLKYPDRFLTCQYNKSTAII